MSSGTNEYYANRSNSHRHSHSQSNNNSNHSNENNSSSPQPSPLPSPHHTHMKTHRNGHHHRHNHKGPTRRSGSRSGSGSGHRSRHRSRHRRRDSGSRSRSGSHHRRRRRYRSRSHSPRRDRSPRHNDRRREMRSSKYDGDYGRDDGYYRGGRGSGSANTNYRGHTKGNKGLIGNVFMGNCENINNTNNYSNSFFEKLHEKCDDTEKILIKMRVIYKFGDTISSAKDFFDLVFTNSIDDILRIVALDVPEKETMKFIREIIGKERKGVKEKLDAFKIILDIDQSDVQFRQELLFLQNNPSTITTRNLLTLLIIFMNINKKEQILKRLERYPLAELKHIRFDDFKVLQRLYTSNELGSNLSLIDDSIYKIVRLLGISFDFGFSARGQYEQYRKSNGVDIMNIKQQLLDRLNHAYYQQGNFYNCRLCGASIDKLPDTLVERQLLLCIDHEKGDLHLEKLRYKPFSYQHQQNKTPNDFDF